jgi:VWFA-related protein
MQFHSVSRRLPALAAALTVFLASAWGQDQPTFAADVKVVSLLATVHDKDGRIVNNLTAGDFTLLEDGVPRKIRYFSRESDLPLTVGQLVDTSRSQEGCWSRSVARATPFSTVS